MQLVIEDEASRTQGGGEREEEQEQTETGGRKLSAVSVSLYLALETSLALAGDKYFIILRGRRRWS